MLLKKQCLTIVSLLAMLGVSAAFAGGPQPPPPTSASYPTHKASPTFSGIYFEANAGYANRDWENFFNQGFSANTTQYQSGNRGTFVAGWDLGYQIGERAAFEAGWYNLAGINAAGDSGEPMHSTTSFPYMAFKMYFNLYPKAYFFFKVGGAYVYDRVSGASRYGETSGTSEVGDIVSTSGSTAYSYHGDVLMGAGAYYTVTRNWSVNLQFLYLPGYFHSDSIDYTTPPISLYLFGIGYKFLI